MDAQTDTLKDIKLHQDITYILEPFFPEAFINVLYNHMKSNQEDLYTHVYLRDSLFVAQRLIKADERFTHHEQALIYAIVALLESGRPLTKDYPYDASPGVAWMFLRLYARECFNRDELRFITQSCKPLKPQTLKPNQWVRLQLVVHNTQRLTDVVNQRFSKLFEQFRYDHDRLIKPDQLVAGFLAHYGPKGNLWGAISESAKQLFAVEIASFKRDVTSTIGDYLSQRS